MSNMVKEFINIVQTCLSAYGVTVSALYHTSSESVYYDTYEVSFDGLNRQLQIELYICSKSLANLYTYTDILNKHLVTVGDNNLTAHIQTSSLNGGTSTTYDKDTKLYNVAKFYTLN